MAGDLAVVIPARFESSRFPGKPLVDLDGVPMVVRTHRQCVSAVDASMVFVATDDQRIAAVCRSEGIEVIETSSGCLTGTDRVAECAEILGVNTLVNVQGDEPVIDPADVATMVEAALAEPDEVLNGYCGIEDEAAYRDPSVPKAVVAPDGRLLYMSRGPVPASKGGTFRMAWRQVCIYAFPRAALRAFADHGVKSRLEDIEDIEILRFLEMGWTVRMVLLSDTSIPVDDPADVERVLAAIRSRGL